MMIMMNIIMLIIMTAIMILIAMREMKLTIVMTW